MSQKKYFVTTPIYYISGNPHIGHLYTTTAADIMARYHTLRGCEVLFTTGSDENSQKVVLAAEKAGLSVGEYVDKEAEKWKQYFAQFHIEYTRFIRTTDQDHLDVVQQYLLQLKDKDCIYKGHYEGWYCVDCESFWTDKEVEDGLCPDCHRPIGKVAEENYFFKLSSFQDQLLDFYRDNPKAIEPVSRYNEVVSMIKGGLRDISISRHSQEWGIRFPFDKEHVLWVWFDALLNYITVCGYKENPEMFSSWWPADCHLMSKDIIRFHCVIWPAMLMALGLSPAKKVYVHGWWLTDGEKMSKSKGNIVDPTMVLDALSARTGIPKALAADVLRWFMFRETSFGDDSVFSMERLLDRYNYDLANDLGNLIHRVSAMTTQYFQGNVPDAKIISDEEAFFTDQIFHYLRFMDENRFKDAIESVWNLLRRGNKMIEEYKPWELFKKEDTHSLSSVLYSLLEGIRCAGIMLSPFMPVFSKQIADSFKDQKNCSLGVGFLQTHQTVAFPSVLFPRVPKKKVDEKKESKPPSKDESFCSIDDFSKFDFRVGQIIQAEKHPDADKLLILKVQIGDCQKQIVAGIAKYYEPTELLGKKVVVVNNLQPVTLRGQKSEGMILCASHKDQLSVVTPEDGAMYVGARVK
ncbi:MAG: methionine--tRNA ligase [Caldisericia bacterium]|nr:methionine--tRNA ligase [Caldisericia bacterium]MDD4613967.1 methionine--tRNA ligase [Caldisericia bacterium]